MNKRRATSPLEEISAADSPVSKKARVEPDPSEPAISKGYVRANGHHDEDDIAGADAQLREEMEEAGAYESEDEEDTEEIRRNAVVRQTDASEGYGDLYLDTIDRKLLDFDFEKLCSVTLLNINVYACLVCGKYYQGRGPTSQAYLHALEENHHVYINMETKKVYVLPEGYEVKSSSLEDVKYQVDPRLGRAEVLKLDKEQRSARDLLNHPYTPGFVGLNNIKANDYFNVIIHALAHVSPLRNYFMLEELSSQSQLLQRFSVLIRKIWNPRAFKSHVSPHELLQDVALRSSKRYTLTEQSDPVDFLSWLLNHLHLALGGSKTKPGTSIIQKTFQGRLKMESQAITARADANDRMRFEDAAEITTAVQRFMILTLDLPPAPLFADAVEGPQIPQVPLTTLLEKYDGVQPQERKDTRIRYRLQHPLPPYLIFHIKRFTENKFISERNPTIVTFPPRALELSSYVEPNPSLHRMDEPILYDMVANVTHEAVRTRDDSVEGEAERKVWSVQVRDKSRDQWVNLQDLFVNAQSTDTLFAKESYVQIWERRKVK